MLISGNTIQHAGNCITVEGHGLSPNQIPTGIRIHDNIIDAVLQPYISQYTIGGICQDSLRMSFSEWRGIWVGDSHDVSILRNKIHNGHVVHTEGEDWYVGGIGIQLDGVQSSEIRENLVDGVTCALVLATYLNSEGHLPYLRDLVCTDNVFHDIYNYVFPAQTPNKSLYLPSFKLGIFDTSIDPELPSSCDYSNLYIRRNRFIWNLDDAPAAHDVRSQQHFNVHYPLRGPLPDCYIPSEPIHENVDFRSNSGNLGGYEEYPLSDNAVLVIDGSADQPVCTLRYPDHLVGNQLDLWAELQNFTPGSTVMGDLNLPDSSFERFVAHPGLNET
ncbi:MAG: right-handed parallel beta-helix repeat-containing protein, partial [Anaerolineae bacterium]|nr:right-handed parallel beta-helix repeat-containing protein [Anaerolineae bacterium]